LCRYPPCSVCQTSLKAFTSHIDCFKLAKGRLEKLSLLSIWLLGLWSSSNAGLYQLRPAGWDIAYLAAYADPADDVFGLIKGLRKLPLELCAMVMRECPDSPLWRYSVVNAFASSYRETCRAIALNQGRGQLEFT
jgi:hypothetical protein